ncbi:MAG: hypothetical protein R3E66_13675 [bacterium]
MRVLIAAAVFLVACEKEPPAELSAAPEPVEVTQDVGVTPDVSAPAAKEEPFLGSSKPLDGTPFDHIEGTLKLTYTGPTGEVELLRGAGEDQSVSGKAMLQTGKEVFVNRSTVFVLKPRRLTAKKDVEVIAQRFDRVASKTGKEDLHEIKAGETVNLLKATGGGSCWMSVLNDDFIAGCPIPDDFSGEDWDGSPTPSEYVWWIRTSIKGAQGWIRVDDKNFSWEVKPPKKRR